jgi:hypothetical protein
VVSLALAVWGLRTDVVFLPSDIGGDVGGGGWSGDAETQAKLSAWGSPPSRSREDEPW